MSDEALDLRSWYRSVEAWFHTVTESPSEFWYRFVIFCLSMLTIWQRLVIGTLGRNASTGGEEDTTPPHQAGLNHKSRAERAAAEGAIRHSPRRGLLLLPLERDHTVLSSGGCAFLKGSAV